jgi:hypothetical protein
MNTLEKHIKYWLECQRGDLLGRFIDYGGHRTIHRGRGNVEFVYIPGTRTNRVLLVAHTDTVWDGYASFPAPVRYKNGEVYSSIPGQGIGADDRAGCALLWFLRGLGHSLLLTSGEESGCLGSRWIMQHNQDIATEIQQHQFLMQFDRSGSRDYKCYQSGTPPFRRYIDKMTGYREPDRYSGTDIAVLADRVCGVNLSIGYYLQHTARERLVLREWDNTRNRVSGWLNQRDLPRFPRPIPIFA